MHWNGLSVTNATLFPNKDQLPCASHLKTFGDVTFLNLFLCKDDTGYTSKKFFAFNYWSLWYPMYCMTVHYSWVKHLCFSGLGCAFFQILIYNSSLLEIFIVCKACLDWDKTSIHMGFLPLLYLKWSSNIWCKLQYAELHEYMLKVKFSEFGRTNENLPLKSPKILKRSICAWVRGEF